MWAWLALSAVAGPESQTAFHVEKGTATWDFDFRWKDPGDGRQQVTFSLPATQMLADREEETWLPRLEMYDAAAKAVRKYGKGLANVKVTAQVENGALQIGASGTGDVRGALKGAEDVRDAAIDEWLAANQFMRLQDDSLSFDHAKLAADYADDLAPVASALRAGTTSDREFVGRALSFVQSIPYEARKRKGGDPGYRRPLALLSRNRGDCDSKSVLFLGLVHAELPALPLAVVYVPGHALTGVGLAPEKGDRDFKSDGVTYVYAEPVGPAQFPVGTPADANKKAGKKGEVHAVP